MAYLDILFSNIHLHINLMKKLLLVVIALLAFGSLGGVLLAGLNIYTRSTTPVDTEQTQPNRSPAQQFPALPDSSPSTK